MDAWLAGLIVLCVVGLGVILYGALSDRARNRRAAAEMLAPPRRSIPQFRPDETAPHYLSELQAHRPPPDADPTDLTQSEREQLTRLLKQPSTTSFPVGYATPAFVTDPTSRWAVLSAPRLLLCTDPVQTFRELLDVVERLVLSRTPLIIVAPALSPEVLSTLEVNAIRRTLPLVALIADRELIAQIATATGATPVDRVDLQAGYVPDDRLGTADRWISTAKSSAIIPSPRE